MLDIEALVAYWRGGSEEDWAVAMELLQHRRERHALFLAHLALEKVLKAHICRETRDLAPRIHNLVRLAQLSGMAIPDGTLDILAEMNAFGMEGRYPTLLPPPSPQEARGYMDRGGEVFRWLLSQL